MADNNTEYAASANYAVDSSLVVPQLKDIANGNAGGLGQWVTTIPSYQGYSDWTSDHADSIATIGIGKLMRDLLYTSQEKDLLREMPSKMLNERIEECQKCTRCNIKQCIKRLVKQNSDTNDFCFMKQMLLHGFCSSFSSAAVEDIQATAEGEE